MNVSNREMAQEISDVMYLCSHVSWSEEYCLHVIHSILHDAKSKGKVKVTRIDLVSQLEQHVISGVLTKAHAVAAHIMVIAHQTLSSVRGVNK